LRNPDFRRNFGGGDQRVKNWQRSKGRNLSVGRAGANDGLDLDHDLWRDKNPVTGQARINGTAQRPAMSASFEDRDGKPFVFKLKGRYWCNAMTALGFYEELETIGLGDLGVVLNSNDKRDELPSTLDACFACGHRDL
jgi:crotonobetainyl-CoA:carnitine CoA-transferase CaiB-like acyl-CoA transferase